MNNSTLPKASAQRSGAPRKKSTVSLKMLHLWFSSCNRDCNRSTARLRHLPGSHEFVSRGIDVKLISTSLGCCSHGYITRIRINISHLDINLHRGWSRSVSDDRAHPHIVFPINIPNGYLLAGLRGCRVLVIEDRYRISGINREWRKAITVIWHVSSSQSCEMRCAFSCATNVHRSLWRASGDGAVWRSALRKTSSDIYCLPGISTVSFS